MPHWGIRLRCLSPNRADGLAFETRGPPGCTRNATIVTRTCDCSSTSQRKSYAQCFRPRSQLASISRRLICHVSAIRPSAMRCMSIASHPASSPVGAKPPKGDETTHATWIRHTAKSPSITVASHSLRNPPKAQRRSPTPPQDQRHPGHDPYPPGHRPTQPPTPQLCRLHLRCRRARRSEPESSRDDSREII